jgi:two-component system LytT family response regulator
MLKAVIIDDEDLAIEGLSLLLENYCEDVEIIGTGSNVLEGIKLINSLHPDLVFLDIEMPHGSGLDLVEAIPDSKVNIIFTTAHAKYAIKAIKMNPIDYLLKPIDADELTEAVSKVKKIVKSNVEQSPTKKLILKTTDSIYIVNTKDIIRCESDGNYTHVCLVGGEKILVSKIIKEYDEKLCGLGFVRIHQSHLINLDYLVKIDKTSGMLAVMVNGDLVPVSSRKKDILIKHLDQ